jgi:hypothetical protein
VLKKIQLFIVVTFSNAALQSLILFFKACNEAWYISMIYTFFVVTSALLKRLLGDDREVMLVIVSVQQWWRH